MTDVAVIILSKDEKLHIGRCLERLAPLEPRQVFVVDCFSTDGTQEIVTNLADANSGKTGQTYFPRSAAEFRRRAQEKVEESPRLMPLAEAIGTVVHRQIAAGSNPSTTGTIAYLDSHCKVEEHSIIQLVEHEWPGLYAKQFNWALDNLPIEAKWVLRLDADEYFAPDTVERLRAALADGSLDDADGLTFELRRRFMGGEIRHGTNGIRLLRPWRYGRGRLEDRAMDEHVQVPGRVVDFDGAFYDDNLNSFEWWKEKHRGYARREAMDAISLFNNPDRLKNPSATDKKKIKYYKLPPYFRALAYFCVRYFLKLGFLDGVAGFRWHFWQGLWYRWLVDREIAILKSSNPSILGKQV